MRVLFDQGTPVLIRRYLQGHEVTTARELRWGTLSNGDLLHAAEQAQFDVFLTTDTHLAQQQNLRNRKLAIVALNKNRWKSILLKMDQVVSAVETATPGTYRTVDI